MIRRFWILTKVPLGVSHLLNCGFILIIATTIIVFTVLMTLRDEVNDHYNRMYGLTSQYQLLLEEGIEKSELEKVITEFKNNEQMSGPMVVGRSWIAKGKFFWNKEEYVAMVKKDKVKRVGSITREIQIDALQVDTPKVTLLVNNSETHSSQRILFQELRPDYLVPDTVDWQDDFIATIIDPVSQQIIGQYDYFADEKTFYLIEPDDDELTMDSHYKNIGKIIVALAGSHLPYDDNFSFNELLFQKKRDNVKQKSFKALMKLHYLLYGSTNKGEVATFMSQPLGELIFHKNNKFANITFNDGRDDYNFRSIAIFPVFGDSHNVNYRIICRLNDLPLEGDERLSNSVWFKGSDRKTADKLKNYVSEKTGLVVNLKDRDEVFSKLNARHDKMMLGLKVLAVLFCILISLVSVTFFKKFIAMIRKPIQIVRHFGGSEFSVFVRYIVYLFSFSILLAWGLYTQLYYLLNNSLANYYFSQAAVTFGDFVIVSVITFNLFIIGMILTYRRAGKG